MDEIRFLNILAPSQNVKQPGIADSNSTNLPPIISRFPPGSILAGFVINRDPAGNPVLRTENGDITFQSNLFFKIGTELVIRIENRGGQTQARIVTVDGQPPATAEKVAVLPTSQEGQSLFTTTRPPADSLNAAATPQLSRPVPATNVNVQATITATLLTDQPDLPQGSQVLVKLIAAEAPPPPQTLASPAQQPQATVTLPSQAVAQQPLQQPAQPTHINPQYAAYAKASSEQAPAIPAPLTTNAPPSPASTAPAPQLTQGQLLQATVTGSTPASQTIIQTPSGITLQLNTTSPLPQGVKLTFEIGQITQQPAAVANIGAPVVDDAAPDPVTNLATKWPAMQQILGLLTSNLSAENLQASGIAMLFGHSPATQASPEGSFNPKAIPAGLMVFIAALRGGDFRGWLGRENASWLEDNGHKSLVRKAEGEFLSLGRQFTDVQPGQWQTLFFPIATHGEVQQVRFFLKRDRKHKNDQDGKVEDDTRFIVELDLSQMGELQLDGFVRKNIEKLEFDLYIRTRNQLDEAARQDIFTIYNAMAELTGYKGQLAFQTVQEFPVHPMNETHPDHVRDVSA